MIDGTAEERTAARPPVPDVPAPDPRGPGHQVPAGRRTTDLGGVWEFSTAPAAAEWDSLPVPGNWDVYDRYADHQGDGWYRRTFYAPAPGGAEVARLRFEAVCYTATVWLDGTELGTHVGGYTPFEFDVTALLAAHAGPHTVTVRANNDESIGATWPWGGISGPVTLTVDPAVRIERQQVTTRPALPEGTAEVATSVTLSNAGDRDRTVRLAGVLTDGAGRPLDGGTLRPVEPAGQDVTVPAGATTTVRLGTTLPAGSYDLWSPDHPALYRATVALGDADGPAYALSDRFGIRAVEVLPDGLALNGERIRAVGFNRVPGDRTHGAAEPMSAVRAEIDRMKQAGAAMTRIHHLPQSPELLDYLDEVGMLNIAEISVWGKETSLDPERWKPELREMVHRDANHACIIAWSVANEIRGTEQAGRDFVRTMTGYARAELDDSRPLTCVSNTYDAIEQPQDEALQYADFLSVNMYRGYAERLLRLRRHYPDKPVFVTEFSSDGYAFTTDRESIEHASPHDAGIPAELSGLPWVIGASRWTFDDYRSRYPGASPNQMRGWGVQTEWGGLKRSYDQMRAAFAPVAELRVAPADGGSRIVVVPRGSGELPSRTLRGHRLRWRAVDAGGGTVAERWLPLPDIEPGGRALDRHVEWGSGGEPGERPVTEHVGLVDPQGHEVAVAHHRLEAPAAPRVTQTVSADGALRVVFDHVAGADAYRVEAAEAFGPEPLTFSRQVHRDRYADFTGLDNAAPYRARVVAVSSAGEQASGWTDLSPRRDAGPLPPDVQALVPVSGGAVLHWRGGEADRAYGVEVADAGGGEPIRSFTTRVRGFSRVEGLGSGRRVRARVRVLDAEGAAGAWSQWLEATTA